MVWWQWRWWRFAWTRNRPTLIDDCSGRWRRIFAGLMFQTKGN